MPIMIFSRVMNTMQKYAKDLQSGDILRFQADQLAQSDLRTNTPLESTIIRVKPYLTYQILITTTAGMLKPVDYHHIFTTVKAETLELKGQVRSGQYNDRKTFKGIGIE